MSKGDVAFSVVCSIAGAALGFGIYGDAQHAAIGFGIGLLVIPIVIAI